MRVELIVPFRFGEPARDAAWKFVRAHHLHHHRFRVTVGSIPAEAAWSKGRAAAHGFARSKGEILVVHDADVLVAPEALRASIAAVRDGAAWSQPHGIVYRLSRRTSSAIYAGLIVGDARLMTARALERRPHPGPHGGGIVVCTREAWEASGGLDPRFVDWGGEDVSWARALDTLAGPCVRFDAPMWHLWHPRMDRRAGNRASDANERLASLYLDAVGDPEAMRRVVASR